MIPEIDTDILLAALHSQAEYLNPDILREIIDSQNIRTSPEAREASAITAAERINDILKKAGIPGLPPLPPDQDARMQKHLREIRAEGITLLGPILKAEQVKDVHRHLDSKGVYGGHVWAFSDRIARPLAEAKKKHPQVSYVLEDIFSAPHILEAMCSPFMLKLAEQYLGCTPTVFQSNFLRSFAEKSSESTVAQTFHRDWDSSRFCVLFIYMTDVDEKTGPHQYIRGTHLAEGVKNAVERYNAEYGRDEPIKPDAFHGKSLKLFQQRAREIFRDKILQIEQPAGFAFMADAFGLHRGLPLISGERSLFWARYGLYDSGISIDCTPNPLPEKSFAHRMPDDETHHYVFRSLLRSEFTSARAPSSMHPSPEDFDVLCQKILLKYGRKDFIFKAVRLLAGRLSQMLTAQPLS